jgi:hypothetical protein
MCLCYLRTAGETCREVVVDDTDSGLPPIAGVERVYGVKPFVFSRNVNLGIQAAGDDDVVILNDDALLETPRGLARLARDAAKHPEYGVIAASCDSCGTPSQVHCDARYVPDGAGGYHVEPMLHDESTMLAFICVYIPRWVIDKIGLLDERFGVNAGGPGPRGYGCDDDDYCWRVRGAGLKLAVENDVVVNHTRLKSTFRADPEHPADVRLHEKVFEDKWGVSPRTGEPSWWAPHVQPKPYAKPYAKSLEENAALHKRWEDDLEAWRNAREVTP